MGLEREQSMSEMMKVRIPKGVLYALEDALNQRTVRQEDGEIVRIPVDPLLVDSDARFGEKIGNYQRSVSLGLIGLLMNLYEPDYFSVLYHFFRRSVSLSDAKRAVERLSVHYTVNTPIDSLNDVYDHQESVKGALEDRINELEATQARQFETLLQGIAVGMGVPLAGDLNDKRLALKNTKTQDALTLLHELYHKQGRPKVETRPSVEELDYYGH